MKKSNANTSKVIKTAATKVKDSDMVTVIRWSPAKKRPGSKSYSCERRFDVVLEDGRVGMLSLVDVPVATNPNWLELETEGVKYGLGRIGMPADLRQEIKNFGIECFMSILDCALGSKWVRRILMQLTISLENAASRASLAQERRSTGRALECCERLLGIVCDLTHQTWRGRTGIQDLLPSDNAAKDAMKELRKAVNALKRLPAGFGGAITSGNYHGCHSFGNLDGFLDALIRWNVEVGQDKEEIVTVLENLD